MFFAFLALGEASSLVTNGFSSWRISSAHDMLWKTCFILHNIDETNIDLKLYDVQFFALLALCVEFPLVANGFSPHEISRVEPYGFFSTFKCFRVWAIEQTIELPVMWNPLMLMWCHCCWFFPHDNDESMIDQLFCNCTINAFCIAVPFWGDSGGHRWILLIREPWGGNLMHSCIFPLYAAEQTIELPLRHNPRTLICFHCYVGLVFSKFADMKCWNYLMNAFRTAAWPFVLRFHWSLVVSPQ